MINNMNRCWSMSGSLSLTSWWFTPWPPHPSKAVLFVSAPPWKAVALSPFESVWLIDEDHLTHMEEASWSWPFLVLYPSAAQGITRKSFSNPLYTPLKLRRFSENIMKLPCRNLYDHNWDANQKDWCHWVDLGLAERQMRGILRWVIGDAFIWHN